MSKKPYYLVIDFEANCSGEKVQDHEIIEFPAVLVDAKTGTILNEFHTYVKMVTHKQLSQFIKDLTHITDSQVDSAPEWKDCLVQFEEWCRKNNINAENTTVVTCGNWDFEIMFPRQLKMTGTFVSPDLRSLLTNWNNVKVPYKKLTGKKGGMARMLDGLNLELEGHHHSGIDDSRNIAKICHALTKLGGDMTEVNKSLY